jgi:hypothetical protein
MCLRLYEGTEFQICQSKFHVWTWNLMTSTPYRRCHFHLPCWIIKYQQSAINSRHIFLLAIHRQNQSNIFFWRTVKWSQAPGYLHVIFPQKVRFHFAHSELALATEVNGNSGSCCWSGLSRNNTNFWPLPGIEQINSFNYSLVWYESS